jgi:hypothetical protein
MLRSFFPSLISRNFPDELARTTTVGLFDESIMFSDIPQTTSATSIIPVDSVAEKVPMRSKLEKLDCYSP